MLFFFPENTISHQLRKLHQLSLDDYEAYIKYKSDMKDSWYDKRHLRYVPDWLFEDEMIHDGIETRRPHVDENTGMVAVVSMAIFNQIFRSKNLVIRLLYVGGQA